MAVVEACADEESLLAAAGDEEVLVAAPVSLLYDAGVKAFLSYLICKYVSKW